MPKDVYIFLTLLAALIALRLIDLPRGLHFFLFSALVVGQVAFLTYGLTQARRRRR